MKIASLERKSKAVTRHSEEQLNDKTRKESAKTYTDLER